MYFGQLETEDGAVLHLGDTQTASTDRGDDETVEVLRMQRAVGTACLCVPTVHPRDVL